MFFYQKLSDLALKIVSKMKTLIEIAGEDVSIAFYRRLRPTDVRTDGHFLFSTIINIGKF